MTTEVAAALTWPVLSGAAVGVVVLLLVAGDVVGRIVTIVHEGGHMVLALLTGGSVKNFYLNADRQGGGTAYNRRPVPIGGLLTTMAGYVTPPLLGLGGAMLLKAGKAWPLLWTAVGLLVLAWVKARDELTSVVCLIVAGFIGYVALYGAPVLQAALATGLVVLLLLGGLRGAALVSLDKTGNSDAVSLARRTLIPASLWRAAWVLFALFCVWQGFQVLVR